MEQFNTVCVISLPSGQSTKWTNFWHYLNASRTLTAWGIDHLSLLETCLSVWPPSRLGIFPSLQSDPPQVPLCAVPSCSITGSQGEESGASLCTSPPLEVVETNEFHLSASAHRTCPPALLYEAICVHKAALFNSASHRYLNDKSERKS